MDRKTIRTIRTLAFFICTLILCMGFALQTRADVTKDGYVFQIEQPEKAGIVSADLFDYDIATGKPKFLTTDEKSGIVSCSRSITAEVFSSMSYYFMWYDPNAKDPLTFITKEQAQTFVIKDKAGNALSEEDIQLAPTFSGALYSFCFQRVGTLKIEYSPAGFTGQALPFTWHSQLGNYGFYEKLPTDSDMTEGWMSGNIPFQYTSDNRTVYFLYKENMNEFQRLVFKTEQEQKSGMPDFYIQLYQDFQFVMEKADESQVKVEKQADLNGYHVYKLTLGPKFETDRLVCYMKVENKDDNGRWSFGFDQELTFLFVQKQYGLHMAQVPDAASVRQEGDHVNASFLKYWQVEEGSTVPSVAFADFGDDGKLGKVFGDPAKLQVSPANGLKFWVDEDTNPGTCNISGVKPGIYTITSDGIRGSVTFEVVGKHSQLYFDKKMTQKITEKQMERLELEPGDAIYVRVALEDDEWFSETDQNKMLPEVRTYQKARTEEGEWDMLLRPVKKNPPIDVTILTFTNRLLVIELKANKKLEDVCHVVGSAGIISQKWTSATSYGGMIYRKGTVFGKEIKQKEGEYTFSEMMLDGSYKVRFKPAASAVKGKKTVTIADSVTVNGKKYEINVIAGEAFKNNKTLKKVVLPKTIREIESDAFNGCKNLASVDLSKTKVEVIGLDAFRGTKIKTVTLPKQTTTLETGAFANCKKLKTVTLGKGIRQIDEGVFKGAKNIKTLTFKGTAKLDPNKLNGLKDLGKKVVIKVPGKKMSYYKKLLKAVCFKGKIKKS
ncbi:MAG: leucine-rich repeat domain-containing protein [Lachnospiraceae bacterium]|nr:leucine-rich repeat domain-containing protein [Lachnospiraceae bacterium]